MRQGLSISGSPAWALCAAAGMVGLLLAGCSSQVPQRHHGVVVGDQGEAWDVAMTAPEVAASDLAQWPGLAPEYARLDGKLAVGYRDLQYPLDQWPAEPTPSLEQRGYILIPRNPGTVTFFRRR